jgi:hypothetical protein
MVEAMVALTLVDAIMMQKAQCELFPNESPMELQPNPMGSTVNGHGQPGITVVDGPDKELAAPVSQRIDEE